MRTNSRIHGFPDNVPDAPSVAASFEASRGLARITGCQKRCDIEEWGARRTWLSACRLRAISRPPHTHTHVAATDVDAALWQSVTVVGDAGINHLGYYTCAWRPDGRSIATHGHSVCFDG